MGKRVKNFLMMLATALVLVAIPALSFNKEINSGRTILIVGLGVFVLFVVALSVTIFLVIAALMGMGRKNAKWHKVLSGMKAMGQGFVVYLIALLILSPVTKGLLDFIPMTMGLSALVWTTVVIGAADFQDLFRKAQSVS